MTEDFNLRLERLRQQYQDASIAERRWDGGTEADASEAGPLPPNGYNLTYSEPYVSQEVPDYSYPRAPEEAYAGAWFRFSRHVAWVASALNEHMRLHFGGRPGYFGFTTMSPDGRFVIVSHRWNAGSADDEARNAELVCGMINTISGGQITVPSLDTIHALDRPPVTIGMHGHILEPEP